jgi:hypothetical protein
VAFTEPFESATVMSLILCPGKFSRYASLMFVSRASFVALSFKTLSKSRPSNVITLETTFVLRAVVDGGMGVVLNVVVAEAALRDVVFVLNVAGTGVAAGTADEVVAGTVVETP